ncbi:hypothetical protein N7457_009417 [Penicillium paradoxum]|uniref:uncharacterized protein n=1 Tax=Penicillium paradoxum TaxID=176176 RepID=UPI00254984A3|nr:uncharacterized protein N7457_009417 [Penicillium paradoxum]KAJ5774521.1 hypothetical protein N7457_009417 [Penicillium paradoxum]
MFRPIPILEADNEEWQDNQIHNHYKVPMQAVRAKPRVLMHCDVCRDTTSGLKTSVSIDKWINADYFIWEMAAGLADSGTNPKWTQFFDENYKETWTQVQHEFEGIADLPERFLHKVQPPPFQVAELRIQSDRASRYWRLRANTDQDMVNSAFWDLWSSILKCDVPTVGPFAVVLKAPLRTPAGEDPIDPWNMSPSSDRQECGCHSDISNFMEPHTFDDTAPLDSLRLPAEAYGGFCSSTNLGPSESLAAPKGLVQCLQDCLFRRG